MFTPQGRWFSGLHRSAVDAAPPQLLLRRRFCTAVCRGRWRAQPSATKERYGCGPPLAGAHRPFYLVSPELPCVRQRRNCVSDGSSSQTPHPSPRRKRQASSIALLVLSELQTLRWFAIRFLYCALPRAILWPLRGLNALFGRRIVIFPVAYGSDECTTRICGQTASISVLLISGILGQFRSCTAPCRGRCPQKFTIERDILHHRRIRRCAVISTAGCFTIFPAWQLLPMGALSPHRRRCSSVLQRDSRVLAAMFFYGLILWHRGTIRSVSSASFCLLFLARQKK